MNLFCLLTHIVNIIIINIYKGGSYMKISTKGRYALRVMIDLALNNNNGEYISIKEISERQ